MGAEVKRRPAIRGLSCPLTDGHATANNNEGEAKQLEQADICRTASYHSNPQCVV